MEEWTTGIRCSSARSSLRRTPSRTDRSPSPLLSEELGYDLVTFQDHPYQPRFHDTWTLLSYVAAVTTKIQLAPNVLNLPLRPAPVIARSAASLDLLSDGRFNLGLGAGAFWDAIEAMGGRRLSPGQAVDALSEAIDLIRGIWDPGDRTPLHGGRYDTVRGAKRGPVPAHAIPIWVGAYKPRMLGITGAKADGWLPSLGRMESADLRDANARIDDAAERAGRAPSDVRRLLNISGRGRGGAPRGPRTGARVQHLHRRLGRRRVPALVRSGDSAARSGGSSKTGGAWQRGADVLRDRARWVSPSRGVR